MSFYHARWAVIALCLLTFLIIAVMTDQIFEHVPHSEDEVAYVFQAKVLAQNRVTVPTPPNEAAFWSPFVVDYAGKRFGIKPPGWALLLNFGIRLGRPWLINAWLAIVTLSFVAQLGSRLYGPLIGLAAAGLGVVTPGFIFLSSSLLSHTASLFWSTLALFCLYRLITSPQGKPFYGLITGFSLGFAFITRPFTGLGIGVPLGVFLIVLILRRELRWTTLLWPILGGLPVAACLPLYLWAISGSPTFNPFLLVWPYDRIGFGPDVGPHGYSLYMADFCECPL